MVNDDVLGGRVREVREFLWSASVPVTFADTSTRQRAAELLTCIRNYKADASVTTPDSRTIFHFSVQGEDERAARTFAHTAVIRGFWDAGLRYDDVSVFDADIVLTLVR